jgi:hypothetical protein
LLVAGAAYVSVASSSWLAAAAARTFSLDEAMAESTVV